MFRRIRAFVPIILVAALAVVLAAACGGDDDDKTDNGDSGNGSGGYPLTVTDILAAARWRSSPSRR
jgi:hypothetical protein